MVDLNTALPWIYALALAVLSFLGSLFGRGLGAYIAKRGENQAAKETQGELTRIDAAVRHDFEIKLAAFQAEQARVMEQFRAEQTANMERFKADQTHRFLAAEARLHACQEAFTHWRDVMRDLHSEQFPATLRSATRWWEEHCLYLDKPARQTFIDGMNAIYGYKTLFTDKHQVDIESRRIIQDSQDRLMARFDAVPAAIFSAAKVPELVEAELKTFKEVGESQKAS
jgi:hypothetical protein